MQKDHNRALDIFIEEKSVVNKRDAWHEDHMRCPMCLSKLKKGDHQTYSCSNEYCITLLMEGRWNNRGVFSFNYFKHKLKRTSRFSGHGCDGFINECSHAINSIERADFFSKRDVSSFRIGGYLIVLSWQHVMGEIRLLPKRITFYKTGVRKTINIIPVSIQQWMDDREYLLRTY